MTPVTSRISMRGHPKKLRILFHILPYMIGGPERYLLSWFRYLDRKKFEPLVVSFSKSPLFPFLRPLGIRTFLTQPAHQNGGKSLLQFIQRHAIDIVVSTHYYPLAALSAFRAGIPHVWLVGSDVHVVCKQTPIEERKDFLNAVAGLSTKIICYSKFISKQFKRIAPKKKINIIYPGIDLNGLENGRTPIETKKRKEEKKKIFRIGMVAHLTPVKRHKDFIKAARIVSRKLPGTRFFILGRSYPDREHRLYEKSLHKMVKKMGLHKRMTFTEAYTNIMDAINRMDILVSPSLGEGMGISILEAMALKKPVIACRSGGPREIIKDRITGFLISPRDPHAIAKKIIDLTSNPSMARKMGEAGRKRITGLFDAKQSTKSFEKICREIS